MKCSKCGSTLDIEQKFCGYCGTPQPDLPLAFENLKKKYLDLKASYSSGEIDRQQFEAALHEGAIQDDSGLYWMLGVDSADWYCHDGVRWLRAIPGKAPIIPIKHAPSQPQTTKTRPPIATSKPKGPRNFWVISIPLILLGCAVLFSLLAGVGYLFFDDPGLSSLNLPGFTGLPQSQVNQPILPSAPPDMGINSPVPSEGISPQAEPDNPIVPEDNLPSSTRFEENFDDNAAEWLITDRAKNWRVWIENGGYHILVLEDGWESASSYRWKDELTFGDFICTVTVRYVNDLPGYYGLAFRMDRVILDYYAFIINPDGEYRIIKRNGSDWIGITDWTSSPAINTRQQDNVLKVRAVGDQFTVYANGQELKTFRDPDYTNGYIALAAGAGSEPGIHVVFDNLIIERVE